MLRAKYEKSNKSSFNTDTVNEETNMTKLIFLKLFQQSLSYERCKNRGRHTEEVLEFVISRFF